MIEKSFVKLMAITGPFKSSDLQILCIAEEMSCDNILLLTRSISLPSTLNLQAKRQQRSLRGKADDVIIAPEQNFPGYQPCEPWLHYSPPQKSSESKHHLITNEDRLQVQHVHAFSFNK